MTRPPGGRFFFRLPPSLRRVERDVEDELRFHFDSRVADLTARGIPPHEARRIAEREYGDVAASRAELAALDRRMLFRQRCAELFDVLRRDVAYTVRGFRRSPGLVVTIVVALGLGVGANAAIFTVLDRVFFQAPPGVVDPGDIRRLYAHKYSQREPWYLPAGKITPLMSARDLTDLGEAAQGTAEIEGDYLYRRGLLRPGEQRVLLTYVSPGYFGMLGVRPALGRFFAPEENRLTGPPVPMAVISDAFWRRHFGAAPDVLGRTVRVDETIFTVVGVAPRIFEGLEHETVDLWAPLATMSGGLDAAVALRLLARVKPGTDPHVLDRLLTAQYLRTHHDDEMAEDSSSVITAPLLLAHAPANTLFPIPGMPERTLSLLARMAGTGLVVLVIAMANVASLLLMRAIRRRHEIAIRLALGVSRARLVAQLLTESALLAVVAGGVALLIAALAGNALRLALAGSIRWTGTVVDHRVVLFAMGLALLGGLLAGLAPALFALRTDIGALLRSSSPGTRRTGSMIRTSLLVAQSALCMALLAGAGVFVQSLRRAGDFDRGFEADRTIQVTVRKIDESSEAELSRIAERIRALPGVEAVGRSALALRDIGLSSKVGPNFRDTIGEGPRGPTVEFVDAAFIHAAGFRVANGRLLTAADDLAPVAILNQALAEALWPGGNAVGRCVHVREPSSPCRTVIGVVRDAVWDVTQPARFRVYVPLAQAWAMPPSFIPNHLLVRMHAAASAADVARLRGAVEPMMAYASDLGVQRVHDLLEPQLQPWRLAARLFLLLGTLGLLAAAAGIYGLIAYDVTQRSRELGVRIALGATPSHIVRVVIGSGLRVVLFGIGAGFLAALAVNRVMASLLFATSPYDPMVLVITALTLVAAAALAGLIPAWRAIRVNPAVALSAE